AGELVLVQDISALGCVMTPYYSEETVYSKSDLDMENEDGICIMYYLQKIFPDEWENFMERRDDEDNYLEEAFKMRNLLEEFHEDHGVRPQRYWCIFFGSCQIRKQASSPSVNVFLQGTQVSTGRCSGQLSCTVVRAYLILSGLISGSDNDYLSHGYHVISCVDLHSAIYLPRVEVKYRQSQEVLVDIPEWIAEHRFSRLPHSPISEARELCDGAVHLRAKSSSHLDVVRRNSRPSCDFPLVWLGTSVQ
ncbi:callose synthase 5-like protein, partial [Tanacetum coccineum]